MKTRSLILSALTLGIVICFSACSSVPLASEQDDQAAKQFQPSPDHATIYVFRDQIFMGAAVTTPLFLDEKLVGGVNDFTFRKLDVSPGEHKISASSNTGAFASLSIQAENSQIYFVRLTGWPRMLLLSASEGRKQIQKCELVQP